MTISALSIAYALIGVGVTLYCSKWMRKPAARRRRGTQRNTAQRRNRMSANEHGDDQPDMMDVIERQRSEIAALTQEGDDWKRQFEDWTRREKTEISDAHAEIGALKRKLAEAQEVIAKLKAFDLFAAGITRAVDGVMYSGSRVRAAATEGYRVGFADGQNWRKEAEARVARASNDTLLARVETLKAALYDIKLWASKRCPCENDEPKICPLCDADVSKDRCMAVDATFPKRIREQIDAALASKE
jgi:hypothetical protein